MECPRIFSTDMDSLSWKGNPRRNPGRELILGHHIRQVHQEKDFVREAVKQAQAAYNSARQAYYANMADPALVANYQAARQAYYAAREEARAARNQ